VRCSFLSLGLKKRPEQLCGLAKRLTQEGAGPNPNGTLPNKTWFRGCSNAAHEQAGQTKLQTKKRFGTLTARLGGGNAPSRCELLPGGGLPGTDRGWLVFLPEKESTKVDVVFTSVDWRGDTIELKAREIREVGRRGKWGRPGTGGGSVQVS